MTDFGRNDPREMPKHFFAGCLRVDFATAVRSDPDRQNRSICPRYWYVDAIFRCSRCDREFAFTADEQRVWYEELGFWIDSLPKQCPACRRDLRDLKATRQEYDRRVEQALASGDPELEEHLARVIDRLYELGGELPARIHENRRRLAHKIAARDSG
jgi:hypothetical protein